MLEKFQKVIATVEYPGFEFVVRGDHGGLYLQVRCEATCNVTGEPMNWSGRKWRLSKFMTKSELVQTAFKAVITATEHEVREQFKYKGTSIFDPHYDVDALHALRQSPNSLEERHG